jgi:hypothetical protein
LDGNKKSRQGARFGQRQLGNDQWQCVEPRWLDLLFYVDKWLEESLKWGR